MSVRLGSAALVAAAAGCLSGCGPNWVPAKGSITRIDRACEIIETSRTPVDDPREPGKQLDASKERHYTGECADVAEWDKVRTKHSKKVEGEATVAVMYTRADGQTGSGELHFDGGDPEFYDLRYGDDVNVLVDPENPAHLRKA
ncbi:MULTISPECIES: hypothetical protein [Sphingomonas]|uniref:hypothetical protein n=1 Tax=Sphingomonas TaxID=13687 RepID=UPI00126A437A|nr:MULTISPECIES: hypothetical protein [Sphingomonas]